jgi:NitT/TauT family transport system ATP-binding protein
MNVSISNLDHTYTQPKKSVLHALKNINLEIQSGQFVALIGPSGCGKSTLLRILSSLVTASQGDIRLGNLTPSEATACKQVSWMAQNPALLPWHTVYANVAMAQRINPQNSRVLMSPEELLNLVKLDDFSKAYPFTLSGGMQQRVVLARTLASGAAIWLMDEPFSALDELTREALALEVLNLWGRFQTTILWVTHLIQEAVRLADRVLVMSPRPGEIRTQIQISLPRPRDDTSAAFQQVVREVRENLSL